jgi:hypothetical protein
MMRPQHRFSEVAQASLERREREDAANRLRDEIPSLVSLRLEISQGRASTGLTEHARTIVVERAPALFEIACFDRSCRGGGHDLTRGIMDSLRRSEAKFSGEDQCRGTLGGAECNSVLKFRALAVYR